MTTTDPLKATFGIGARKATANIVATFRSATPEQRAAGASWYDEAHALAVALDRDNVERAAGVIAALSPRMPWARNVALAVQTYADGAASGTMGQMCRAADRILAGEDFRTVLRGPKTRAFAATIADPAHADDVVIDRHALSVILGRCSTDADTSLLDRKGVYGACAAAYVRAARHLGVSATVVQATTWVVWRESQIRTAAAAQRERTGERAA